RVVEAVEEAIAASPLDGVSAEPKPRCVVVDYQEQSVHYGVLVWMTRPGLEYVDASQVRARIYFALARIGSPLVQIAQTVELEAAPPASAEAQAQWADKIAGLRNMEIFHSLSPHETEELAAHLQKVSFAPGEIILRQGDPGD